jgi:general secretion pathway protein A
MYQAFFGLRERPFDLLPNPRFLFLGGRHREALANLRYGLTVPKGFTLLLGEAGTGKTTLVQSVLAQMDRDSVECVLLSNPTLTRAEFYEFLADGFGLGADAALSKTRFLVELQRHLQARHESGRLSALVIDEAQSLPCELLEEVRLLGNIETTTAKLLNVVLAGQPELAARLNEPGLRQLKQRIALRCELGRLDVPDTAAYIAGRLRVAGGEPAAIFSRDAIQAVHETAGGIPRTINVICDNALVGGFAAQVKPVVRAVVEAVCRDFDVKQQHVLSKPATPVAKMLRRETDAETPPREQETETPAAPPAPRDDPARQTDTDEMFGAFSRRKRFSFF